MNMYGYGHKILISGAFVTCGGCSGPPRAIEPGHASLSECARHSEILDRSYFRSDHMNSRNKIHPKRKNPPYAPSNGPLRDFGSWWPLDLVLASVCF